MNLIAAADANWGIGKDGGLLVHLPGDLRYFKEKTSGKAVIMGVRHWRVCRAANRCRTGRISF